MTKASDFFQVLIITLLVWFDVARSQLSADFYKTSCPNLLKLLREEVENAVRNEMRAAAYLIDLQHTDCVFKGCTASTLLEEYDGEIKTVVEGECSNVVSCADIMAIAARDSVLLSGGKSWTVLLGRRDGLRANYTGLKSHPSSFDSLDVIVYKFAALGLNVTDVVALSGGHTIGLSSCENFEARTSNFSGTGKPDPILDTGLITEVRKVCTSNADGNNLVVSLDLESNDQFDNHYFTNLVKGRGILHTDQVLYHGDSRLSETTKKIVQMYSEDNEAFLSDFAKSMIKMGNIGILTGNEGTIRKKCSSVE